MRTVGRLSCVLAAAASAVALVPATPASAHPLGNFTVNRYAGIEAVPGQLRVIYAVDVAEIPTQQLRPEHDVNDDGRLDGAELGSWADATGAEIVMGLRVRVDGEPVPLRYRCGAASTRAGQAGLEVVRFDGLFTAAMPERGHVEVADTTGADRTGWREITAAGVDGSAVSSSSVPAASVSDGLRRYPDELLASPLSVTSASFDVAPGGTDAAPTPSCEGGRTVASARPGVEGGPLGGLVANEGLPLVAVALLLAMAFGAWHALLPGHGKTLMAAYMVSSGARVRQAVAVGGAVALMHTASVLALGLAVLALERTFRPEALYPWLGLTSGLVALGLGMSLLIARLGVWMEARRHEAGRPRRGDHTHETAHGRQDAGHVHRHDPSDAGALSRRGLVALALAGGILPAPSALIVMLAAINAHRVVFGLSLVVAFSVGLAAALIVIGLGALKARAVVSSRLSGSWGRLVPVLSAAAIVAVGGLLSLRGLSQI